MKIDPEERNDWQDNTESNPFWKSKYPVQVELKGGKSRFINCPACHRDLMSIVVRWRYSGAIPFSVLFPGES